MHLSGRSDRHKEESAPLCEEEILTHLDTDRIGRHLEILEEIDSTNNFLGQSGNQFPDGAVAVTEFQTAGKGRHGRQWISPRGRNLMFSLLLKSPSLPPPIATLIGALAVIREANHQSKQVFLKWPNDVVAAGQGHDPPLKKVAGVLCEMKTDENGIPLLILGIGVNVNVTEKDFPEAMKEAATSLEILSGKNINRNRLLAGILTHIESYWSIAEQDGTEAIVDHAKDICSTLGRRVRIKVGKGEFEGKAVDLDPIGRLLIADDTGSVYPVELGEVVQTSQIT